MSLNSERAKPIGVFDSGVGGLTVVNAITKMLPHENIIYFGDTARVPYGPKSPQTIREYAAQDTDFLIKKNVKIIVVACNTVSSVAIDVVQNRAKVPVVGVTAPCAKAAVRLTRRKIIGIIGTVGTILSNAYADLIRQIDSSISVISQACPLFVPLAEEGWINHKATQLIAWEYLFPLKLKKIDTLILGCTHYPLLRNVISEVFDNQVTLIDSAEATAEEVMQILIENDLLNNSQYKPRLEFFVSDVPYKFGEIGERFLGQNIGRVRRAEGFSF